ncbi:hypothetical protein TD95_004749 [Thielaviopsis punctulata]|uniref:Alpha/beta hydrolase fold-3 domain-containing protein n=1 Tax=Thielaviopsis punctulata TaxID=72032 RepID=A0A0F4ZEI1_9PEZI|nr:hypothetical protein TD95_004749 [Thielaviopsis punctulata]
MSQLKYDADYQKTFSVLLSKQRKPWSSVEEIKSSSCRSLEAFCLSYESTSTSGVSIKTISVKSFDNVSIDMYWTAPDSAIAASAPRAAVLYLHPGGHCAGSAKSFTHVNSRYARSTGLSFFAVEYRLAPEFPAPYGLEDALAAFQHLAAHSAAFNIDPARIIVMGDSSGGGMAAGLCLLIRDRNLPVRPVKQMLCEPMLDDCTVLPATSPLNSMLSWFPQENSMAWQALLGVRAGDPQVDVEPYYAPARAQDLTDLPPAYLDIGSLDLFVGETMEYAKRLSQAGVAVELHVWPGLPHMHDFYGIPTTTRTMGTRSTAMKKL